LLESFSCNIEQIEKTKQLGKILAKLAQVIKIKAITLEGDLGTGKTTLCKSIADNYLEQQIDVSSPTFTLLNIYETAKGQIYHYDLYRIKNPDEMVELGIEEALNSKALILIEWPNFAANYVKTLSNTTNVDIVWNEQQMRKASIRVNTTQKLTFV